MKAVLILMSIMMVVRYSRGAVIEVSVDGNDTTVPVCDPYEACFRGNGEGCPSTDPEVAADLLARRIPGVLRPLKNAIEAGGALRCDNLMETEDGAKYCTIDLPVSSPPEPTTYQECCCKTTPPLWALPNYLPSIDGVQYYAISIPQLSLYQCADSRSCWEDDKVKCTSCLDGQCVTVYRWEGFYVSTNENWPPGQIYYKLFKVPTYCKCNCPLKGN